MLRASGRSYVCWRCTVRSVSSDVGPSRITSVLNPRNGRQLPSGRPLMTTRALATVRHPANDEASSSLSSSKKSKKEKGPDIYERLRQWEEENPSETQSMMTDFAHQGDLSNTFTRPQNVTTAQFDVTAPLFDGDELSELRSDDMQIKPGDLVEMSSESSRRPMLAVCLGRFNGYEHYYTNSGKWFTGLGVKTLFVVNQFARMSEIEAIINEIPTGEVPVETLNALQDLGHGPSRTAGAPLLRKMQDFEKDAEAVYQANAGTLDASSSFIGDSLKHRYLTLHEIADLLLSAKLKENDKFSPATLYAVHRALLQDEIFFRPLKATGHRRSYMFEVSPLSEVRIVQRIENIVRDYFETPPERRERQSRGGTAALLEFFNRVRRVIDRNRASRKFSPHGMVGPSQSPTLQARDWSAQDIEILQFMELWASYQKFPNYSRLQCLGSAILRGIERYKDVDNLNATVGWTFLQEIGWIPPWEIASRYKTRFPNVELQRGGGFNRPIVGQLDRHIKADILQQHRKQWNGTTAYCIDAESTEDIDDAVSLERTSNPDEYWIHVHVADPASCIPPETTLAKHAELVPETIYLPGHFDRMLPGTLSKDRFSLGTDASCLTFSALVNTEGMVLDRKITPGVLKDVIYITGEAVNIALGETREDPTSSDEQLIIGRIPDPKVPERKMTRPEELGPAQKNDLAVLAEIGRAFGNQRLNKGATPIFQARAQPQVYFDSVEQTMSDNGFFNISGDPSIQIIFSRRSGTDLVEHAMRLAGEVAAQWCSERGIPIPYRSQPLAAQNAALIQQYTRDVFYPLLKAGVRPDDNQWRRMRGLLGGDEISTTPGLHFTLGADMYTKATSPLRRFSDLLVHWQIEAALLQEYKQGKSLVGNKSDSFLPFSRERMDRMLPMLRLRERQARSLGNGDGADQWILQALVRAWRFKEAPLPSTFKFTVAHIAGRTSVHGRLDWFDRAALMRPEHLGGVARIADVRLGDVFQVELKDVNVHTNQILVQAMKLVERAEAGDIVQGQQQQQLAA